MLISIVIPIFNEEATISELYKRIDKVLKNLNFQFELIFIDDSSCDLSLKKLEELREKDRRVKIISFSRNFGHQVAISAGIDYAAGEAAIIMDGDLQDPPELIPEMLEKYQEGYEIVYAKRKTRQDTFFKKTTASLFYCLINILSDTKIPQEAGDFRLLDKKALNSLKQLKEKSRFIRGLTSWIGFRQAAIEYERDKRFAGETNYPLNKMIKLAIDSITSFSYKPLKIATYIGFGAATIGFLGGLYALVLKILEPSSTVLGWTTIIIAIFFMGGIQLMILGIIGEYIGRIYTETQNRPLYIVDKELGFENDLNIQKRVDGAKWRIKSF